jgi:hypothetical protein
MTTHSGRPALQGSELPCHFGRLRWALLPGGGKERKAALYKKRVSRVKVRHAVTYRAGNRLPFTLHGWWLEAIIHAAAHNVFDRLEGPWAECLVLKVDVQIFGLH